MEIIAPVTDYMKGSLLTTQGDLVKHDGAVAARLPLGLDTQMLRVNSSINDLEYAWSGAGLFDHEISAVNASIITILNTPTDIISIDFGNVYTGGRYGIIGNFNIRKDANAGQVQLELCLDAGDGRMQFFVNDTNVYFVSSLGASEYLCIHFYVIGKITTTGPLSMKILGFCTPNNATIQIGSGLLYAHRMLTS